MSLSPDSSFSTPTLDVISNVASSNSTPPTTIADSASMHSDMSKNYVITVAVDAASESADLPMTDAAADAAVDLDARADAQADAKRDNDHADPAEHDDSSTTPGRARRTRVSRPEYNLSKLAGTADHGKRRANGDVVSNRRRRTIAGTTMTDEQAANGTPQRKSSRPARDNASIDALNLQSPPKTAKPSNTRRQVKESPLPVRVTRRTAPALSPPSKQSARSKRRSSTKIDESQLPRELRRLQDTKEFSHVDEKPIIITVWSNGKYINPNEVNEEKEQPARKKTKVDTPGTPDEPNKEAPESVNTKQRRVKKYLNKGLYAGQDGPVDFVKGLTPAEKQSLSELPELKPSGRINKIMPLPIYTGMRTLISGRDFKLPFNVCNPLPPGQPKPDEWKKMTKNRFIGGSREVWRKSPHFHDYQSKCVCKPEDGCSESCQNRIMLYECDETNCNVGRQYCTNRAFADLTARRAKGGKYRVGVEVIKTSDRGYGVRSNRCFEPHQIIMEYAGEIITEEECERRMNEVYKDNECYYLMSFDQNMIIDATTGSIARFVNHSCNPNCRMIKWIVSGQPRMALFAGDNPITTGEELTYDYNFDPFSAKNVQSCLCGEPNCRGILGPKTREQKIKASLQKAVKETISTGKRKLKDLTGSGEDKDNKAKKPRITSTKEALATVGIKMAKGTAIAVRKGMSSTVSNAKKALGSGQASKSVMSKTTANRVSKAYGKGGAAKTKLQKGPASKTAKKAAGKAASKTGANAGDKSPAKAAAKPTAKATPKAAPKTTAKASIKASVKTTANKVLKTAVNTKTARNKMAVTKVRPLKKAAAAPRMTAAEKMKEELDRQYEITVADSD
ncbi:[histone H3]-lysine4 N-trimethyltransferase ASH1L [Geosmithia morbida]|uniref:[histone H3]-lysine4 N-trimethyltransferase ASH1L n=1 Tax=Geosmithia morbida TaxID=1094350 RepID=A0A9P4YNK4_9HYPO|nr:[histone H3]-lysine4 N-trimethyltransferase ASH1L [Geosmithia morbida]KAF4119865.1 [histone H3]-lysine4 N-trimethyltransferase ASH1L [Geosmithia morbida]